MARSSAQSITRDTKMFPKLKSTMEISWTLRTPSDKAVKCPPKNVDPVASALQRNARAMIDVDYAGSPPVNDYAESGLAWRSRIPSSYPD